MKNETHHSTRREFLRGALATVAAAPIGCSLIDKSTKSPVIDTHMHIWSLDRERFPLRPGLSYDRASGSIEVLIEEMDANGVDGCVIVQSIHHQWDNRYVAHCLKEHPRRFRVQGLIDPTKPGVEEKLEYWVREHNFSGVRLRPIYHRENDAWLTAESSYPLWEKATKLDAIFNFYIGTEQLPKLETMLRHFPKVRVAIDHVSQIDLKADDPRPEMEKLLALAKYPQVWVKVSELASVSKSGAYPFEDAYPWVKLVYDAFGADRLLWGTGYPGPKARADAKRPTVAEELELIREKIPFFTEEDKRKILGANAAELWSFPKDLA